VSWTFLQGDGWRPIKQGCTFSSQKCVMSGEGVKEGRLYCYNLGGIFCSFVLPLEILRTTTQYFEIVAWLCYGGGTCVRTDATDVLLKYIRALFSIYISAGLWYAARPRSRRTALRWPC
jgi:hypothetical protein